jgi:hypothetical protein
MVKLRLAVLFLIFCFTATVFAGQTVDALSSGIISSSQSVIARSARLTDLAVYADGTHDVTVILYDNASAASGTVIGKVIVTGASYNGGLYIPYPVRASKGIYCSISGTGGTAIVFFDPQ